MASLHQAHLAVAAQSSDILIASVLVVLAVIYLRVWCRLRSTSSSTAPAWRAASFLLGLGSIWIVTASPVAALGHEWLTAHMAQHLVLMTVAPILIWLGEPLETFPPVSLTASWLAAVLTFLGWHLPSTFTLAMRSDAWHVAQQTSFLASGLLFWWPVVQRRTSAVATQWSTVMYLFMATLPCDLLSGLLVFSERVAYPVYITASRSRLAVLDDQQCAGALMWTGVTIVYLAAGAILSMRLLSTPESHAAHASVPMA